MTIRTSFEEEVKSALKKADLPTNLTEVIGRTYLIGYEEGSHHATLSGTVRALELSDEGPEIKLYISSPMLRGDSIEYVFCSEHAWRITTSYKNTGGKQEVREIRFALQ